MNAFAALRASFVRAADVDEARLSLTTLPTLGTSWLTPKLGQFRKHPGLLLGLDVSAVPRILTAGRFDAAIRNGHGRWPGLQTTQLLPSIFMPLCAPALKEAAGTIADPAFAAGAAAGPTGLVGAVVSRTRLEKCAEASFGTQLGRASRHRCRLAGHGVAIGSPILFKNELASGRLVPAHDLVASDGRSFWLAYPARASTVARSRSSASGYAMKPRAIVARRGLSFAAP